MRLRPLIVLCLLTVGHCVSSSDNWCVDDDDDDHSDVYQSALDYLASSSINQSQLQQLIGDVFLRVGCYRLEMTSLTNMSCERCLSAENIYELLQLAADETLNRTTFHRSSTVIISFIYRLTNSCDVNNRRNWSQLSYDHFTDQLLTITSLLEDEHHYHDHDHEHDSHEEHEDSKDDDHDDHDEHEDSHEEHKDNKDDDDHDHEHHEDGGHKEHEEDDDHDEDHGDEDHHDDDIYLTTRQLEHMLRRIADSYQPGQSAALGSSSRKQQIDFICSFGDLKSFTSADVYRAVKPASPEHGIMSHELGRMSSILIMKLLSGECIQQVDENVPAPTEFVRSIYEIYASKRNSCRLSVEDIKQMTSKLGVQSKDDHDDHNDDHNDHDGHAHKRRRRRRAINGQNPQSPHQRHFNNSACYSVEQLLRSFDIAESSGVSRTDFHRLCPAIVQQAATSCQPPTTAQPTDTSRHSPSDAEVYGYGTASVFVITVISLCGLFVIRFRHTVAYNYLVNLMLGLAVGTLVGDAMLHLIPHALGLHQHNDEHDDHAHHTGEVVIEPFVWKTLCSTLTVWLFFVVQSILHWISRTIRLRRTSKQGVQKRVATADSERCETDDDGGVGVCSETENSQSQLSASDQELMHTHADPSAAWMVTVGDAVHNLADGMAIGVSYTAGWETGLSTSIAVFCHELPHEFGDVAIMVTNGWSTFKVAVFQLLSGATAFIGLYIGITITQYLVEAQEWIFIVAAAMFLYIALADVVPELFEHQAKYGYLPMLMMANVGILFGVIVMLALAIFENQFRIRV